MQNEQQPNTVGQLAEVMCVSPKLWITTLEEAGLHFSNEAQPLTGKQKYQFLAQLRESHGNMPKG